MDDYRYTEWMLAEPSEMVREYLVMTVTALQSRNTLKIDYRQDEVVSGRVPCKKLKNIHIYMFSRIAR